MVTDLCVSVSGVYTVVNGKTLSVQRQQAVVSEIFIVFDK